MQAKLIITFERLSESDFQTKAGVIVAALTGNANFPEPWPAQVPSLAQITDALNTYRAAYHAALTRDTSKISQRNAARQTLTDLLKRLAPYLEAIAQGNPDVLATSGYDLRHDTTRGGNNTVPEAPSDFRVSHGQLSGTLDVHTAKLPGAGSYEVHLSQGDPSVEANWKLVITSTICNHIPLSGLTPGQTYWLRLRAINSLGAGVWTAPVSVIVI